MRITILLLCLFWFAPVMALAAAEEGDNTIITVTGAIVNAPRCNINGNDRIDVDFGDDIDINLIDGVSYKKTRMVYDLQCDDPYGTALTMTITGTEADFGSGLIKTDKTGLAIQLYNGDIQLGNREVLPFLYNQTHPDLWAVLKADSSVKLSTGGFHSQAVLVINYP